VPPVCVRRAACRVQPWELPRRDVVCLPVLCYRGRQVHRHCRDAAEIAKTVHPDAALAHHRDDPAAHCSDDMSAERQPGACLAAHLDAAALDLKEALRDAMDSVAVLTVRQQDAERLALLPQDVLPQARFPALPQVAAARRVAAQMLQAQRPVARQ